MPSRTPALLAVADFFYGTLAAVRTLGRAGVPLAVADPRRLAPARWSRYTKRRLVCPEPADGDRFIDWLLELAKNGEKHFLYPTNDDTAWLYALHRDELGAGYFLYQPTVDAIYGLLNKRRLFEACRKVGLDTPKTWFPESISDLTRIADEASYPVIVKPVTQIFFRSRVKGRRTENAEELLRAYRALEGDDYAKKLVSFDPSVAWPIVQEFFVDAAHGIYGVSGFIDESGELRAARASMKVLQRPKRIGVGLCFEERPLRDDDVERLFELCRHVGYYGVFEAEFVISDGRALLIDMNPRFYNQMGFDCDRGLPLPLFAYEAALGGRQRLAELVERAGTNGAVNGRVYTHRFSLELTLKMQELSGALPSSEAARWRAWLAEHIETTTDAAFDGDDPFPSKLDAARLLFEYARHPRAFLRSVVLDR